MTVENFQMNIGQGVKGLVDHQEILAGNKEMLNMQGINLLDIVEKEVD